MKGKKTGGRKLGSANKTTKDHRQRINLFITKNWGKVQKDYNKMDPKDRLIFFERLLKYTTPALTSVSATVDYERLSDNQLNELFLRLTKNTV